MNRNLNKNDIDILLDKIRSNCTILSRYHQKRYLSLKSRLKFYRIPIIVLSALNSVTAVGLSPYLAQKYVSLLNMLLSLIVGIIGSVEMYYAINTQMENESIGSRDFYILGTDIYKYLSLKDEHKSENPVEFLNNSYNRYIKLIETSIVLKKKVEDKLVDFDINQLLQPTRDTPPRYTKNTTRFTIPDTTSDITSDTTSDTQRRYTKNSTKPNITTPNSTTSNNTSLATSLSMSTNTSISTNTSDLDLDLDSSSSDDSVPDDSVPDDSVPDDSGLSV